MAKKTSSEMLLEAGILPKNAVSQLEKHRLVPQGTTEKHGNHPVSLDRDSGAALKFADDLQRRLDDEEAEIRQQDLAIAGKKESVWLLWGDGSFQGKPVEATVDKLGRVYLPVSVMGNGQKKKVKGISFTNKKQDALKVGHIEPRYEGQGLKYLVCHLEER